IPSDGSIDSHHKSVRVHLTPRSLRYGKSSVTRPAGWPIPKIFVSIVPVVRVHPGTLAIGAVEGALCSPPGGNDIVGSANAPPRWLTYRNPKKAITRTNNGMRMYRCFIFENCSTRHEKYGHPAHATTPIRLVWWHAA